MTIDPTGIAVLIAAIGTFITTVVNAWILLRQTERMKEVHNLVNGQSEKLNAMFQEKGRLEEKGRAEDARAGAALDVAGRVVAAIPVVKLETMPAPKK